MMTMKGGTMAKAPTIKDASRAVLILAQEMTYLGDAGQTAHQSLYYFGATWTRFHKKDPLAEAKPS